MKISLIFPGQGSQFIGMGKDFNDLFPLAKNIYSELDSVLGRSLSNIIFSGSEDELRNTIHSQPSIMATSVAIYKTIIEEGLIEKDSIKCVAGHSLGEYSALVANESLSLKDSIKLLDIRSRAMQESMPIGTGGMAAIIGKKLIDVEKILPEIQKHGKIFIANDNADGQVVLSGEIKAIEFICKNYKEFSIKRAIQLPVSAPFHCELMRSATEQMIKEIANVEFKKPEINIISNVTAQQTNNPKDIKNLTKRAEKDLLGNDKRMIYDIESILINDVINDKTTLSDLKLNKKYCKNSPFIDVVCLKYIISQIDQNYLFERSDLWFLKKAGLYDFALKYDSKSGKYSQPDNIHLVKNILFKKPELYITQSILTLTSMSGYFPVPVNLGGFSKRIDDSIISNFITVRIQKIY